MSTREELEARYREAQVRYNQAKIALREAQKELDIADRNFAALLLAEKGRPVGSRWRRLSDGAVYEITSASVYGNGHVGGLHGIRINKDGSLCRRGAVFVSIDRSWERVS